MIKTVELAVILAAFPAIAVLHMREDAIRNTCPVALAYIEAEQIAEKHAGPYALVSFGPERWIGECHLELEGDIRNAAQDFEPKHIAVTLRVTNDGRPLVSSR